MSETKPRAVTPADNYAGIKDDFLRETLQRVKNKAESGKQYSFFQLQKSRKQRYLSTLNTFRALQATTTRLSKELNRDRAPVPIAPYSIAPRAIIVASDISNLSKLVFLNLLWYSQDKKSAWPSQSRLASDLCKSTRQIQRALNDLWNHGYLFISMRRVPGNKIVNQYELNLTDIRSKTSPPISK